MNFRMFGWVVLVATSSVPAAAQGTLLRGRVIDRSSGQGVPDAIIAGSAQPNARARSDVAGAFTLQLELPATLIVGRLGFRPETLSVGATASDVRVLLDPAVLRLTPTLITVEQPLSAAVSRTVREVDIALRPRASSQELLRLAPGLVIAQHAGGGKAEQIFLRGFDADHGTDVAVSVDGVPVNIVSHGHGQGYADLHFVIPEIVDRVDVRKGPYDTRDGDLAVAGSVNLATRERIDEASMALRYGSFGTTNLTTLLPFGGDASRAGGYVAASTARSDGPFDASQDFRRWNGFARYSTPLGSSRLGLTLSGFSARWDASGQIPDRAVRTGLISRFGAIDSTEGGRTSRFDAIAAMGGRNWGAKAYATRYDFRLFSNFTFFLDDSVNGDGIEQVDDRVIAGASLWRESLTPVFGLPGAWRGTLGGRWDDATVGLYASRDRTRFGVRSEDRVRVQNAYGALDRSLALSARTRLTLGLRADAFRFDVTDRVSATDFKPVWYTRVSPKGSLAVDLTESLTMFANAGAGFHSNDARAVMRAESVNESLPRALGYELGLRQTWEGASIAVSAWRLDLTSELVWSGDAGTTEASGASRRVGIDVEGRAQLGSWLWADADVNLARGRFRDEPSGADRIPLAPTLTSNIGLTTVEAHGASSGLRWRHVRSRPAIEDNSVRAGGYSLIEIFATLRLGGTTIRAAVDNALNTSWNEAQFATTSRLRGESAPVTELHYTPGAPRMFTLGVQRVF
ncbi:MAG: TonB-dependent receptor [Gemmatimonadota bacterium]